MQTSDQQDSNGNILSPEAKEFVPRQPTHGSDVSGGRLAAGQDGFQYALYDVVGPRPAGGLPGYVTTCYPFVPAGDVRFGPRGRGKFNNNNTPQLFLPPQFAHPGFPRSRFPTPSKGFIPAWNQPFSNLPNGMPFDGGTYQNGFVRPSLPQVPPHDPTKPVIAQPQMIRNAYISNSGDATINNVTNSGDAPLMNGYKEETSQWKVPNQETTKDGGKSSSNLKKGRQLDGISVKTRKSVFVQTDFPANLANATLEDVPNSLYKRTRKHSSSRSRHKTRRQSRDLQNVLSDSDDEENDNCHANIYQRKNQVSNGTNPTAIGVSIGIDHDLTAVAHGNKNSLSYKEIVTGNRKIDVTNDQTAKSVPYSHTTQTVMLSYASVAQGLSSHNKSGLVSTATKSDKETCDSKNVKNVKSGLENVNVAQIMEDLEKAGSLNELSGLPSNQSAETIATSKICNQTAYPPVYTWGQSNITENQITTEKNLSRSSYSGTLKQNIHSENQVINWVNRSEGQSNFLGYQVNQSSSIEGHGQDGQENVDSKVVTSEIGTDGQDQLEPGAENSEETTGKKKRKRRRRRKKKSGESGAVSDDVNSGANDEITLHFEDEEEFPDLSGNVDKNSKESSPQLVPFSYSDILKTGPATSPKQYGSGQDAMVAQDDQSADNAGATGKETRNSRKRRKRREVANKAADAEMAEINLEQHMLELKMKQKQPLAAKKSASPVRKPVSPVRTSPVQSIWKHPGTTSPSQPSSSGKKVSLLLPGTVAPDNATVTRQPNPSAKQYSGILKTTQSSQPTSQPGQSSQPVSQSPSSGGGTLGVVGGGGKKSKQPITYDLGALIDALEEKKKEPPPKKETRPIINKKEEVRSANMLDSSAPIKRGKEREIPKIKKPSPLKKVILKEREEKKRLRLLDDDETTTGAPVGIGVVSGESDLSQDASSSKGSMEVGLGTPASAELSPISQPSPSLISPMSPGASPISSGVNSPQTGCTQQIVKLKIHSRRFREYCNQVLDKEIDSHVAALLSDLVRFQDKQYHKDPIKAKAKRRFVLGLREVTKHLKLRKIKCVIISPNLEKIQSKGGLDDALNSILDLCNEQGVPFVFALGRRALGRACAKLVPVSVVGIFNYEGSEDNFKSLVSLTEKARDSYKEMISQIEKEIADQPPRTHVPGVPHIFAHMGHSRTPSGCSVISFTSSILSEPISENYPYSEPETDNRGYEIEKGKGDDIEGEKDNEKNEMAQDSRNNSFENDPYEADDESGGTKKCSNRTSSFNDNVRTSDNISQHISTNSNRSLNNSPVENGSNVQSRLKSNSSNDIPGENHLSFESGKQLVNDNVLLVNNVSGNDENESFVENSSDEDESEMLDRVSDIDVTEIVDDNGKEGEEEESSEEISDNDQSLEDCDTIRDLPYIDSVHHFDLHEILSTHSSKTLENGEDVLSTHSSKTTHSSRTPGDGSTVTDKNCKIKIDIKHGETTSTLSLKGKNCMDKENRTLSWVKEAQTLHFNDEIEKSADPDETQIETNNVAIET